MLKTCSIIGSSSGTGNPSVHTCAAMSWGIEDWMEFVCDENLTRGEGYSSETKKSGFLHKELMMEEVSGASCCANQGKSRYFRKETNTLNKYRSSLPSSSRSPFILISLSIYLLFSPREKRTIGLNR